MIELHLRLNKETAFLAEPAEIKLKLKTLACDTDLQYFVEINEKNEKNTTYEHMHHN